MIGGKTLVITYQEEDYISNDSHNLALYYNEIKAPNRNLQLFLVSSLYRSLKPKYHWGDSISKSKIKEDIIMLPVKTDGNIDYDFIDNLISAQSKLCIHDILATKDLEISVTEETVSSDTSYMSNDEANVIELPQAAEPFEVYGWGDISEKIPASSETILIGCYRDKRHLDWILATHLYNIRSGRRKGSSDAWHKCFGEAKTLYLYDSNNLSKVYTFRISGNKEMSGKELAELNYPRKSPGKSYMTFSLVKIENPVADIQPIDIQEVLDSISDHIKGTPVFIEAEK